MNFDILLLCGTVTGILLVLLPIKELKGNTFNISLAVLSVVVVAYSVKGAVPLLNYLNTFYDTQLSVYIKVLTKVLGITLICNITSDMTADLGMPSLSGKVEFAGKIAILLTTVPLFDSLISHVEKFL